MSPFLDNEEILVTLGPSWTKQPHQGAPSHLLPFAEKTVVCCDIAPEAQHMIWNHAQETPTVEVGGLLLGDVYQQRKSYLVNITNALPAQHTEAGALDVTFTIETWLELIASRSHYPDNMTVGWYHSHPGIGVFLSGQDLFTHQSFFADQPWYLALVVDPESGEQGVFFLEHNKVIPAPILSNYFNGYDRSNWL